jgi:hypothetical protein
VLPNGGAAAILLAILLALPLQRALLGNFLEELPLIVNDLNNGSRGRARTFNPTVNSRVLYH